MKLRKGLVFIELPKLPLLENTGSNYSSFLLLDPKIMKKSGRILIVAELAREYEFKDVGGVLV